MGILRYKILRDLWANKSRTLQVVLIIGIGAAAIGMILSTRNIMVSGMQSMWRAIHPAMIDIFVSPPVSEDELQVLRRVDGVKEIEGMSSTIIEWRLNPGDEWNPGNLVSRADYKDQKLNQLELISGNFPSGKIMATERGADTYFGISPSGTVYLRVDRQEYLVKLGGTLYNQLSQPPFLGGRAQFYATQVEYDRLVGSHDFSQLYVTTAKFDQQQVAQLGDRLQSKLRQQGKQSNRAITDPNKHFFQDQIDGLFFLLGILGALSLVLGLLLVYNTINAVISQQVDQIGIMKAIGARTWQILRLYLVTILMYSVLATLIALPLGILGGWAIASWLITSFGASPIGFEFSPQAIAIMIAICLIAPLLASLIPIYSGARITVREAISTYGLSTNTGLLERILAKIKRISRLVILTISNTFQHRGRVILLQISLVISGLIFMMVISVQDSVVYTIRDVMFSILNADVTLLLDRPERIDYLQELLLSNSEVKAVEMWGISNVTMRPGGQPESEDDESSTLLGVPLPTQRYGYQLRAGRWLDPQDTFAIVLNAELAGDVGVNVGDWVTVKFDENRKADFRVVGLIFDPILTNSANIPRDILLREINMVGRANTIWIETAVEDSSMEIAVARELRTFLEDNHVRVSAQHGIFGIGGDSTVETGNTFINLYNFLVILLGIMAVIIGAVGSIALSGALSLSVLERRREIGVMRAIGASSWTIARLFIGEGVLLGWLSWLIALPLSIPAGQVMVKALGPVFNLDVQYLYTPKGAILWFAIITILSVIASWLPAWGAARIRVRESLAYQ